MSKSIFAVAIAIAMCAIALPAHAKFGKIGKSLGKAAKSAGNAVAAVAGDAAMDMAANKVSTKVVEYMDKSNTVSAEDSEYTKRLNNLVAKNYAIVDGVAFN